MQRHTPVSKILIGLIMKIFCRLQNYYLRRWWQAYSVRIYL